MEVGTTVQGLKPGDLVACAGGGHANHAEIVSVPANLCAKVPEGVSLDVAAITTIAAIPLHGIRLAGVSLGDTVAVIGCGLVGQIACRLLSASGARIVAIDTDAQRVEQARKGGVDLAVGTSEALDAVQGATGGLGVDQVLITAAASSNEPLLLAADIARDRGSLVLVGDVPVDLPRSVLYARELSFRVSRSYGPGRYDVQYEEKGLDYPIAYVRWTEKRNMECVLDLLASKRLQLDDLLEVVPVERAAEAYERLLAPPAERPRGALLLDYGPSRDVAPERSMPALNIPAPTRDREGMKPPIRIGLIGPGSFASRVLIPAFTRAGASLEIVGGGSGPSAEAAARSLGFARLAESAEAVIEDDAVEAVVIATRHGSHAHLAREALAAGKHVFCEKPLALTVDELSGVLEVAAIAPGVLAVGFNRRFAPLLDELHTFVSWHSPLASIYRVSAGRLSPGHWTYDLDEGGGRLIGEASHFVDALAFVSGSDIVTVHAAGYGSPELPMQAHDNLALTLRFANDSIGSILYVADGSRGVPKERLETFSGTRTAILDDYRTLDLFGIDKKKRRRARGQDKGHNREVQAFIRAIEGREAPVPLSEIGNVSLATLAAVESLRTGQTVRVPLANISTTDA
jgi:polar amino acid transport system substrate-binding protein